MKTGGRARSALGFGSSESRGRCFSQRWNCSRRRWCRSHVDLEVGAACWFADVKAVHGDVKALLDADVLSRSAAGAIEFPFESVKVEFMLRADKRAPLPGEVAVPTGSTQVGKQTTGDAGRTARRNCCPTSQRFYAARKRRPTPLAFTDRKDFQREIVRTRRAPSVVHEPARNARGAAVTLSNRDPDG